jgi:antitoxin component of MazEF toxin-antitoxin module
MKTQIKKWGDSKVIVLSLDFLKYHDADVGDWVDISDIVIIKKDKEDE